MAKLVIAAAVTGWAALAIAVPTLMARRGYDRTAWFAVTILFGPIALLFAVVQASWSARRRREVVRRGEPGVTGLALLVVGSGPSIETARAVLRLLGDRAGHLTLAHVLPLDGPRAIERDSALRLREDANALGRSDAELILLFGEPADGVAVEVETSQCDLVVADVAGLAERLADPQALVLPGAIDADAALRVWTRRSERADAMKQGR